MILLVGSEGPDQTANAQVDLGLCTHMLKDMFPHGTAKMMWTSCLDNGPFSQVG